MVVKRKKQEISVEIINPEALEIASEKLSKMLVDIWWNSLSYEQKLQLPEKIENN